MDYLNKLEALNIDAFLVKDEFDKRYLTNFSGTTCEIIVAIDGIYLISDGRYQTQISQEVNDNVKVIITNANLSYEQAICNVLNKYNIIGIDSNFSIKTFNHLQTILNKELKVVDSFIKKMRQIKTADEIAKIKQAINISEQAFLDVLPKIKPGVSERFIKAELEKAQIMHGASDYSFPSIVASGVNSCKPHARFSDRIINDGDILTIDWGCYYQGYVSDMTRTFFVGKPNNQDLVKIHQLVDYVAKKQIEAIKPGVKCSDIDQIAHDIFSQYDADQYFKHGTGHGIGLDVHEQPYLNRVDDTILQPGMTVTVEPGLYIDNLGGVRIEQDILVTQDGCEVLTNLSNDYDIRNKLEG